MPRFCLVLLLIATLSPCAHATSPHADRIFPDSTKGFFAVRNLEEFVEQWEQTQFGRFMNDPLMDDFKKEVQKQLTERMESTFGLTLDGISSLPSGEVAFGMIAIPGQIPGYVLTMDVSGKRFETNEYLANLTQKLVSVGVQRTTETYRGQQITVLVFPPPEPPPTIRGARREITLQPVERRAYYMFLQDILIASDRLPLLQFIADRLAGQSTARSLADVPAYQTVMRRCFGDMPAGIQPIIRWYVEPLDYGESVRIVMQNRNPTAQNRRDRPSIFAILKQHGFDAIQGIGGVVSLKGEEQETVYRTFIHTQRPYRLAMRILDFPSNTNFSPPTWMPPDLARFTMFNFEPSAIFDNFGTLFDAFVMPGEEGVFQDILFGLERDPHGPRISIRDELIAHLSNRILSMTRYAKPITVKSESIVIAVELKPDRESAMLAGIEKLFGTDPEMMVSVHNSYRIWHRRPLNGVVAPSDFDFPDIFTGGHSTEIVQVAAQIPQPMEDEGRPPMFPEGGVVVAKGNLFVATNVEYLKVILDRLDSPAASAIQNEAEYRSINKAFADMGLTNKPHFFQLFARSHETLRSTHEMIRLNQMAPSQALLAKILNEVLSSDEESGLRRQIINGSTLPEFDKVQHYFGTVGVYGSSEHDGYFIKGFTLVRE